MVLPLQNFCNGWQRHTLEKGPLLFGSRRVHTGDVGPAVRYTSLTIPYPASPVKNILPTMAEIYNNLMPFLHSVGKHNRLDDSLAGHLLFRLPEQSGIFFLGQQLGTMDKNRLHLSHEGQHINTEKALLSCGITAFADHEAPRLNSFSPS